MSRKLSDGKHIFKVRAVDGLGNWSPPSEKHLYIDTEGPIIGTLNFTVHEPGILDGSDNYYLFISLDKVIDEHSGPADSGLISFKKEVDNEWTNIPVNLSSNINAVVSLGTTLPATGQTKVTWSDTLGNETIKYRNVYLSDSVTSEGTNVGSS